MASHRDRPRLGSPLERRAHCFKFERREQIMNAHASIVTPGRALDERTRETLLQHVENAKRRGWRPADLRAWFKREGVTPGAATAGTKGEPIDDASYHALAKISITGIPQ